MRKMSRMLRAWRRTAVRARGMGILSVFVFVVIGLSSGPSAQEPSSAPLAAELASLLADQELGAIAAKDTVDEDRYVAALAFPGQLLVVSARYEAPAATERKLSNAEYREIYIDLNAASIAGTKVLVTDAGANGLHADAADNFVDVVTTDSGTMRLDGNGSGGTMLGEAYRNAAADADQQYARMLSALIARAR